MAEGDQIPATLIKDQLHRILTTPAFKNSSILCSFLQYVTDETLAGKEKELKEYTIGVHALFRNTDFNPQLDAIVRIHAGRLRRALKEYYHEEGSLDPLIIEIPKGSYIPIFSWPAKIQAKEINNTPNTRRSKPVVAVLPFRNISKDSSRDFFADGLGEQLSTELSRFSDLSVISYFSSRHAGLKTSDLKEAADLLGTKYIITGSIQSDAKHLRIWVQLILCDNGEQLWSKSFEKNNSDSGLFEIQNDIVRNVLTATGGYYGAIFKDAVKKPTSSNFNGTEYYDAAFWYYHFQKVYTREVLIKTIAALEAAVKADPDYALAWALLSELYVDDLILEVRKIENPLELALECAQRAIYIDPSCQHGYQSLAWVSIFLKNKPECIRASERCLEINPHSADKVGAIGFALTCAGEFERGYQLLSESIQHNPFCPWWFNAGFSFYFIQKKDFSSAWQWAEKIQAPDLFWDPLIKAAVLGQQGNITTATRYKNQLLEKIPHATDAVQDILASVLLSEELRAEIIEGLKKAGLVILEKAEV